MAAVAIDFGHSGITLDGTYLTAKTKGKQYQHPGKRLHTKDGWFYEGVGNRVIGFRLASMFLNIGIPVFFTADLVHDTFLKTRANRANKIYHENGKKVVTISLHSNAGKGKGYEIFTSPRQTLSDDLASKIFQKTQERLPRNVYRTDWSDGDPDKEAKFTMLTATHGPAVLIEHDFFDNPSRVMDLVDLPTLDDFNAGTFEGTMEFFKEMRWL